MDGFYAIRLDLNQAGRDSNQFMGFGESCGAVTVSDEPVMGFLKYKAQTKC